MVPHTCRGEGRLGGAQSQEEQHGGGVGGGALAIGHPPFGPRRPHLVQVCYRGRCVHEGQILWRWHVLVAPLALLWSVREVRGREGGGRGGGMGRGERGGGLFLHAMLLQLYCMQESACHRRQLHRCTQQGQGSRALAHWGQ